MMRRIICQALLFVGLLVLIQPPDAAAYIDPGTGSLVFQILIAFVLGAGFFIKTSWKKIKEFFSKLFKRRK